MEQRGRTMGADSGDSDVRKTLGSVADSMKEQAGEAVGDIKQKGADKLSGVTHAVRGAADELGEQVPEVASYIHAAANRIDGAAEALRNRSVEEMATSFAEFARRQPATAFAMSALAGFALSRFLKTPAPPNEVRTR